MQELIKEIKSEQDFINVLSYYNVKLESNKKDNSKKACCPLHKEKTSSFNVKTENGESMFKCFGCGKSGDIVNFIKYMENMSTLEATKKAYEILGKPCSIKPSKLDKLLNYIEFNDFYKLEGYYIENIYTYMLNEETPSLLKVKYRSLTDHSKKDLRTYKVIDNGEYFKAVTKATGGDYEHTIYNYPRVKKAIENGKNNIFIVEGEKDAETLNKLGLVATTIYSKKWQENYTKQLRGTNIYFIGDTGKAGEEFKKFIWKNVKDIVISFNVVTLPGIEKLGDNADVTDWLEAKHTKEELFIAIKDAWDWKISTLWKDVTVKEDKQGNVTITPKKTIDNFELLLKRTNTDLYFNEISKQIGVKTKFFRNANLNTLATEMQTQAIKEGFNCTINDVNSWLNAIAYNNSKNPFKEFLDGLNGKWDGTSRLQDFYNTFETVEHYPKGLKELIMRKWLLHFIASAYDPKYKGQGILVLKGGQGIGKTTSMENLIPINKSWVYLSEQKFEPTRDCLQTITSNQLVELSEFARSNKEIDALKGFVTSPTDKLVLKYDKYPVEYKRKTVYYATVNDDEFLIDDENRRFWILDLIAINVNHNIDMVQLWAELYHIYHNEDNNYWLNDGERKIVDGNNRSYKFKGELEGLLENTFDFHSSRRIWMTSSEVQSFLTKPYSPTKIARTLKSMGLEQKQKQNKDFPKARYIKVPLPVFWKDKTPSEWKKRIANVEVISNDNYPTIKEGTDKDKTIEILKKEIAKLSAKIDKLNSENLELAQDNLYLSKKLLQYEEQEMFI